MTHVLWLVCNCCECTSKSEMEEKKLLNKVIFVFNAHKMYSRCHMNYVNDVPIPFWVLNVVVVLLSMEGQKALGVQQKNLNLVSEDRLRSYTFRTTWVWVIFGWTILLMSYEALLCKNIASPWNIHVKLNELCFLLSVKYYSMTLQSSRNVLMFCLVAVIITWWKLWKGRARKTSVTCSLSFKLVTWHHDHMNFLSWALQYKLCGHTYVTATKGKCHCFHWGPVSIPSQI